LPGFELPYLLGNHGGFGADVARVAGRWGLNPTEGRWLWRATSPNVNGEFSIPLRVPANTSVLRFDYGLFHDGLPDGTIRLAWTSCALGDPAVMELDVFGLADYGYDEGTVGGTYIYGMVTSPAYDLLVPGEAGYLTLDFDSLFAGAGIALDNARFP